MASNGNHVNGSNRPVIIRNLIGADSLPPDLEKLETRLNKAALAYAKLGIPVFPVRGKSPRISADEGGHGFKDATVDPKTIAEWFRTFDGITGLGTPTGNGCFVLDIDPQKGGEASLDALIAKHDALPETRQVLTGGGGYHKYFTAPLGVRIPPSVETLGPGLDIRGDGGYVVLPPSIHPDTGKEYVWDGMAVDAYNAPIAPAPAWLLALLQPKRTVSRQENGSFEIAEGGRNDFLFRQACTLRGRGRNEEQILKAVRDLYETRCSKTNPIPDKELRKIAASAMRYESNASKESIASGTYTSAHADTDSGEKGTTAPDLLHGFEDRDVGNANRVLRLHGDNFYWCEDAKEYYVWNGRCWESKADSAARLLVHHTLRLMTYQAIELMNDAVDKENGSDEVKKQAKALQRITHDFHDSARISKALTEARGYILIKKREFDRQTDLFNFRNGTAELQTGKLYPHRRSDKLSKIVPWDYLPDEQCPVFDTYLLHAMGNDQTRVSEVESLLGYSITGETREKAVMVCVGPKDTGKTTLLNIMRELLGEYATLIQIDSLMTREKTSAVQEDLYRLAGCRFAMTSETEQNQKLAVARLKQITQGQGLIEVIPKFRAPIDFPETHKLWIDANYLPVVRGEEDIWGRLYPIDFNVVVPKKEQDLELLQKLRNEAPGILAKLVRAAQTYYDKGLPSLDTITARRATWRSESSTLSFFMEERCNTKKGDKRLHCPETEFFEAYRAWCYETEQDALMTKSSVKSELLSSGFTVGQHDYPDKRQVRVWWGIEFKKAAVSS